MSENEAGSTSPDPPDKEGSHLDIGSAESISAAENALRDLIESELSSSLGADWLTNCGCTPERIAKWQETRTADQARREGAVVSDRLIYFSEFFDLKTIIDRNWQQFSGCLGDKQTFDLYMDKLNGFRNPRMHSRNLLPFERSLIDGMTGELRNKITIYRSGSGPDREFFPRIESITDSFGNVNMPNIATTPLILHPGDRVTYELKAWDPEGLPVTWQVLVSGTWTTVEGAVFDWHVTEGDIGDPKLVIFNLFSSRPYRKHPGYDEQAFLAYRVLPNFEDK